jgi:hypothetical protein
MSAISSTRPACWLDRTGATVGLLCAAHCLAFPLIVGMLPLLGRVGEEAIEHTLIAIALLVGTAAAFLAWRRHQDRRLLVLFALGMGLLALSTIVESADVWLLVPASALVTSAHVWSYRLTRRQACCP